MQYLVSFISPTLAAPTWGTVQWCQDVCWCEDKMLEPPPELAQLSQLAPALFRIDLQCYEGRIYVDAQKVSAEYPCLPGHLALMALLKQHAKALFVDPALMPMVHHSGKELHLSPDLRLGELYLAPEWGSLDPVPNPYAPTCISGGMHYYGRHLPQLTMQGPTLVIVPDTSVPHWRARYPSLQMLRDGYREETQLHLMTLQDLDEAAQQLHQAIPTKARPSTQMHLLPHTVFALCTAEQLEPFPLFHCWRQGWNALWLDHCPLSTFAVFPAVTRSHTLLLERQSPLPQSLHVLQQQALVLGVPLWQVGSPWLAMELQRTAVYHAEPLQLLTPTQHWCHLARIWHRPYVECQSVLSQLRLGLGIEMPPYIRLCSAASCRQHRIHCSTKRKKTQLPTFFDGQLAALGTHTCSICLERKTDTLFKCGHSACLSCAQECLWRHAKCPQCRQALITPSSAYHITKEPLHAATVRAVHGSKIGKLWELLHEWGSASVVLVAQLPLSGQRRLVGVLRQLQLPCLYLHGKQQDEQMQHFVSGKERCILMTPMQMQGLVLPGVEYVVYLHALLDSSSQHLEHCVQWALPKSVKVHRLSLQHTVEELLVPFSNSHEPVAR